MKNPQFKAFSIIEVIIWIFIFSIWLLSVYVLLQSAININSDNKNRIIASNLAREWVELVRNIRDSNYRTNHLWNNINPKIKANFNDSNNLFMIWLYYKVSNNFDWNIADFPIKTEKISDFWEWEANINKMQNYRLCLDSENNYTNNCSWNKKTIFYRYLKFEKLDYVDSWTTKTINSWFKVISKVFWYNKGLHSTEIKTVITDYKKL